MEQKIASLVVIVIVIVFLVVCGSWIINLIQSVVSSII
jgi:hypothetical protein